MTQDQKTRAMRVVRLALGELCVIIQDGIDKGNLMGDLEARTERPLDKLYDELSKLPTED